MKQPKFNSPTTEAAHGIAYDALYELFIIAVIVSVTAYIFYLALYINPNTIN